MPVTYRRQPILPVDCTEISHLRTNFSHGFGVTCGVVKRGRFKRANRERTEISRGFGESV